MPLHLDYRPDELDEFKGNDSLLETVLSKIQSDNGPHSYLITGPSGCGKTTLARIMARMLGALEEGESTGFNYKEYDTADFRGIDMVREVRKNMSISPMGGASCRLYLLDECHQLTPPAQEALLKALEDTPDHIYFILSTTDPHKLKDTLKRRCCRLEVRPMKDEDLETFLSEIINCEEKKVPDQIIQYIIEESEGSPGKALNLLDKIIDLKPKDMEEQVRINDEIRGAVKELLSAIVGTKRSWKKISSILKTLKDEDPEKVRIAVFRYAGAILLNGKEDEKLYLIMESFREPFYNGNGFSDVTFSCYQAILS